MFEHLTPKAKEAAEALEIALMESPPSIEFVADKAKELLSALGERPWMPIPKVQGYAWSDNEENCHGDGHDSIESALEAAQEGTDAEHVWIGEVETPDFANLCGDWCSTHLVGSVMDCFDTDFGGDWWESDMLTMEKEALASLAPFIERAVNEWMSVHGGLTAYNVVNAKLYPLPNPPAEAQP